MLHTSVVRSTTFVVQFYSNGCGSCIDSQHLLIIITKTISRITFSRYKALFSLLLSHLSLVNFDVFFVSVVLVLFRI